MSLGFVLSCFTGIVINRIFSELALKQKSNGPTDDVREIFEVFLLLKDEILFGKEWVCWHLIEKGLDLAREGKKKERVIECACLNERQRDREKEERTKTMIASERQ